MEAIFRDCPDGIVIQDTDGTLLEANAGFGKICRQPLTALIGKKFPDLLSPTGKKQWDHDFTKLVKGEWSLIEEECMFDDGRKIPVEVELITKIPRQDGELIILHVRNVSAYHTVETALLAAQNQWELSFNAISNEMLILDRGGHILRANNAALKKLSPLKADPVGTNFFEICKPKEPSTEFNVFRMKILTGPCSVRKIDIENLTGKYDMSSYPILNERGETTGCIVNIEDITDQCRQESLLKRIEIRRQRSYRIETLGRLAGSIAHDFNNILTTLLGYVSLLLQSDGLNRNDRQSLVEIMQTVERGTALARQLFDFSFEKKDEYKTVNMNLVIQNMQKMLAQILGANIGVVTRLDQQLWNVHADVSRLERIITNFATNARDAMPKGGEFIIETINTILDDNFCKTHPELKPGRYVLLQVSDTGTGMPPEIMERIFEPFFTTKSKGKGLGLGLSSVFGIVRQFGGEIICYSEPGKGTTFKVYLPQSSEKAIEEPKPFTVKDLPGGSETILIIDDEIHIVSMLTKILSKLGYRVMSTTNASQAIALCKEYDGAIDIVLSDIIMPDMNGTDLVSALRETHPQLKAIFMSGYTNNMAVESTGMDKNVVFLQKPFTFEELARKIRSSLDEKENK